MVLSKTTGHSKIKNEDGGIEKVLSAVNFVIITFTAPCLKRGSHFRYHPISFMFLS
jgi:hypothetical protein